MELYVSGKFMKKRVATILLISSPYDSFVIEEDGGLTEQIQFHFLEYQLINSPRIMHAATVKAALEMLEEDQSVFDLIITIHQFFDKKEIEDTFRELRAKTDKPALPVCQSPLGDDIEVLYIDGERVIPFIWTGEARLILTMIKLTEDALNVDEDTKYGVRVIIFIEDNPIYISEHASIIYNKILHHAAKLLTEGSGRKATRLERKRTRPKLLVATTYEEAEELFQKYGNSVLSCISDVEFPHNGVTQDCGFELQEKYGQHLIQYLFLSSEANAKKRAKQRHCEFIKKGDVNLQIRLDRYFANHLGFGDFVFRNAEGEEVGRAKNITEFLVRMKEVPPESIIFHSRGNHFSNWFQARGEYALARALRAKPSCNTAEETIKVVGKMVVEHRSRFYRGYIFDFEKYLEIPQFERSTPLRMFSRMTVSNMPGSLGGKARGLLFMERVLAEQELFEVQGVKILTPFTLVLSTQVFEDFMMFNHQLLGPLIEADCEMCDDDIYRLFLKAVFNDEIYTKLRKFLKNYKMPLAVRSSSIMEDSRKRPLAGIYNTYFLPNTSKNFGVRCQQLYKAIKLVYASQFLGNARRYLTSVGSNIGLEKMACIIQEVVGKEWKDGRYYPQISGIAQSYNYYALKDMDPKDGIAYVALGLGKAVVDRGMGIKFGLGAPQMQYMLPRDYFDHSQRTFFAINLTNTEVSPTGDEMFSLSENNLAAAEKDRSLHRIGSVWDVDGLADYLKGTPRTNPRFITFRSMLQQTTFPMADVIKSVLVNAEAGLKGPAEIEFAFNLSPPEFFLLQMRPLARPEEALQNYEKLDSVPQEDVVCRCSMTTGHGMFNEIRHVVYIRRDNFNAMRTREMSKSITQVNKEFSKQDIKYIAVGIGRWGTSEPTLGIPVEFSGVSNAKVIVELALPEFDVDHSLGTHFMHNVMALNIPFLANIGREDFFDWDWLNDLSDKDVILETEFVRAVKLRDYSLDCVVNGTKRFGVIMKSDVK